MPLPTWKKTSTQTSKPEGTNFSDNIKPQNFTDKTPKRKLFEAKESEEILPNSERGR